MSALLPTYSNPSGRCCQQTVTLNSVIVMKDITGFTGGGSTNIDGIATANVVGTVVIYVRIDGNGRLYQLVSSSADTAVPGIIKPVDFSASNPRVWIETL